VRRKEGAELEEEEDGEGGEGKGAVSPAAAAHSFDPGYWQVRYRHSDTSRACNRSRMLEGASRKAALRTDEASLGEFSHHSSLTAARSAYQSRNHPRNRPRKFVRDDNPSLSLRQVGINEQRDFSSFKRTQLSLPLASEARSRARAQTRTRPWAHLRPTSAKVFSVYEPSTAKLTASSNSNEEINFASS
jgi:hypothetical protein